ncbi:MAG: class I SAM-dependent methyltransferase [Chloroflexi bacterium]|nr:class I SAM-dependent methyltransferase [Chloroflexota bacterium]
MERVLEPELMEDQEQADAYAKADFSDGNSAFVRRFVEEFGDLTTGHVVDLGCGPADIPIRLVRELPRLRVTAVDGSSAMLALARTAVDRAGLAERITLHEGFIPDRRLPDHSFAAVLANSLTHHIPSGLEFWREVARLGASGAPVLVQDLFRPESPDEANAIVERVAPNDPPVIKRDFFASLCAAFTVDEVRADLATAGLHGLHCEQVSERHWAAWGRLP